MYTVHAHVKLKKNKNSANYFKNDQKPKRQNTLT